MEGDIKEEKNNLAKPTDEVDYPPNEFVFEKRDALFIVGGFGTYTMDWIFDILTAVNHWIHGHVVYFACTCLFVCFPSLTMTAVSLHWYLKDHNSSQAPKASTRRWVIRILLLVFQLGPLVRYYDTLYWGLRSRKQYKLGNKKLQREYYLRMLYEDADAVFLRLFETFMEAAPQLVLQLTILIINKAEPYGGVWFYLLIIGCITSLLSMAWGLTAYARATRFTDYKKNNISILGSVVMLMWHTLTIGSRVLAMALFASVPELRFWLIGVCLAHWILMVGWLMSRRSLKVLCSTSLGETALSMVLGAVYIFAYVNEKDEPTKKKYALYYAICGIENCGMMVLWLIYAQPTSPEYIPGVLVQFISFILGVLLMIVYYGFLHPSLTPIARKASHNSPSSRRQTSQESEPALAIAEPHEKEPALGIAPLQELASPQEKEAVLSIDSQHELTAI